LRFAIGMGILKRLIGFAVAEKLHLLFQDIFI